MKAAIGDEVGLHYDSAADVRINDIIKTRTGRCYRVIAVRKQLSGKYTGRFHLRCVVVAGAGRGKRVHPLYWYPRGASHGLLR